MHMLDLHPSLFHPVRHEHMVQLLHVLVKRERVSLDGWYVREHVCLEEHAIERGEDGAREGELVEVSREDDGGGWVEGEDRFYECLQAAISVAVSLVSMRMVTYSDDLDLACPLRDVEVHGRAVVALGGRAGH